MPYKYQDADEYSWLMEEVDLHETPQAMALGGLLDNLLHPTSVIDVGCASGIYLLPFAQRGLQVYGVDGASEGGKWIPGCFELVDLRNPWTPAQAFDLALCIEVGEHLRPEHARTLVGTLSRCAPVVFWSAATPGQGGEGHWNEQPQEYWQGLFSQVGYDLDHETTAAAHRVIDVDSAYDHCHWLQWHSTLFRRR